MKSQDSEKIVFKPKLYYSDWLMSSGTAPSSPEPSPDPQSGYSSYTQSRLSFIRLYTHAGAVAVKGMSFHYEDGRVEQIVPPQPNCEVSNIPIDGKEIKRIILYTLSGANLPPGKIPPWVGSMWGIRVEFTDNTFKYGGIEPVFNKEPQIPPAPEEITNDTDTWSPQGPYSYYLITYTGIWEMPADRHLVGAGLNLSKTVSTKPVTGVNFIYAAAPVSITLEDLEFDSPPNKILNTTIQTQKTTVVNNTSKEIISRPTLTMTNVESWSLSNSVSISAGHHIQLTLSVKAVTAESGFNINVTYEHVSTLGGSKTAVHTLQLHIPLPSGAQASARLQGNMMVLEGDVSGEMVIAYADGYEQVIPNYQSSITGQTTANIEAIVKNVTASAPEHTNTE